MPKLEFRALTLPVHLGVGAAERALTQSVAFDLSLAFAKPPTACASDRIEDTLCYASLCEALRSLTDTGEFRTVEHLAQQGFDTLAKRIPSDWAMRLRVHKLRPPVEGLEGGVSFEMERP